MIAQWFFLESPFCVFADCVLQDGTTPLCISARNGHKEMVELLLANGAQVNIAKKVILGAWQRIFLKNIDRGNAQCGNGIEMEVRVDQIVYRNC